MGMVIIFFLFLYVIAAVAVIVLVRRFVTTNRWVTAVLLTIVLLLPTYDIIITNVLGAYYCSQDPNPKTLIKKKIKYPISIYFTSSITSGMDKEGMKPMIINYLDGVHLKTMAINGDDGKVYVYHLDRPVWEQIKREFDASKYKNIYDQYAQYIIDSSEKIYTKETMPKMNYTVTFDEVKLSTLHSKFLYSDETKIIDNNTSEVIAYNRRYMRFFYNIAPDFALGNRDYVPEPMCGFRFSRNFDAMVFPNLKYKYFGEVGSSAYKENQNKNITGEK